MIVLDPDLDPDPAPVSATKPSASDSPTKSRVLSARGLARFLSEAQAAVRLRGEVTVLLTTDAAIRSLNRRFRGKNKTTDVLSFPAAPGTAIAGDLAISVPTATKQAREQGHSLAVEIKVLMLHGLLHLAGYDHEIDDGRMARRERLLRGRLGLPQGLIERTDGVRISGSAAKIPTLPQKARKGGAPRLTSGADGVPERHPSGAKAQTPFRAVSARLKSCPDTVQSSRVAPVSILRPGIPRELAPKKSGRVAPVSILRPGKPRKPTPKKVGPATGVAEP